MDTIHFKKIASASCATLILPAVLLAGCGTTEQRRAQDKEAVNAKAAQEVRRICSLPEPERSAEIKKAKDESGMVIYCPQK